MIGAVVFDIGETILDDTREYGAWADWIGVPRHTFSAVLGAVTAAGLNNAETFQVLKPGFDLEVERNRREEAGMGEVIEEDDLYPDVRAALSRLKELGLWVCLAGNQTARAGTLLRSLRLPVDAIVTSAELGAAKPGDAFFGKVVGMSPYDSGQTLYVGDHRDNDLIPATKAGLRTALIRRGPWGYLWADDPAVAEAADWVVDDLGELVDHIQGVKVSEQ